MIQNSFLVFLVVFALPGSTSGQDWVQVGEFSNSVDCLFSDTISKDLYVGGPFRYYNGIEARGVFRLDSNGVVHTLGSGQDGCGPFNCNPIKTITRYNDEIYVGWVNYTIGGGIEVNGVARWDGVTWKSLNGGFNGPASVNGFMELDGELYISGGLNVTIDSITSFGIVKWNGAELSSLGFPGSFDNYPLPATSVWYQDNLYVGGVIFFDVPGGHVLDIVYNDGTSWQPVKDGIFGALWHGIKDMVVYKDELYVAGNFRKIDGNAGNKIMKWDGINWFEVGGGICDHDGAVEDLLVYNDKLYVAGIFSCVGNNLPASNLAVWDGQNWCAVSQDVFNNRILSVQFWRIPYMLEVDLPKWVAVQLNTSPSL